MKLLLDTNICIYLIKQRPRGVLDRFSAYSVGEIGVSSITVAELRYGVQKSRYAARNQEALTQFLLPLVIVDFGEQAAAACGEIRATLEAEGAPIGPLDALIAAHAKSLDVALVSNNVREFSRVPGLRLETWADE